SHPGGPDHHPHPGEETIEAVAEVIWVIRRFRIWTRLRLRCLGQTGAAHQLVQQVFAAVERLGKFPRMGSIPAELRGLPYRQLSVSPCRIFYRIEKMSSTLSIFCIGEQLIRENYSLLNRANQEYAGADLRS